VPRPAWGAGQLLFCAPLGRGYGSGVGSVILFYVCRAIAFSQPSRLWIVTVMATFVILVFTTEREVMTTEQARQVIVVAPTKSAGVAILLTVLFGPLGMFYSTIPGAFVMLVVTLVLGLVTFGLGLLLTWPICIIWGAMAASSYNKKLVGGTRQY